MTIVTEPGQARSHGLSYQELLDTDTHAVPAILRLESPAYLGDHDKPVEQYTSRAFHELEIERLWRRVWQMACREEEIPEVGDTIVYDDLRACRSSWCGRPRTRSRRSTICRLHRGRHLRDDGGPAFELRCPFHGFCWNLDGSLKQIPAEWDFPHVGARRVLPARAEGRDLGRLRVRQLGPRLPSRSRTSLGDLDEPLRAVAARERYKQAHVAKIIALQLEGRPGGLHGGLPRRRDAPAAARRHRRRELAVRRVRQRSAGPSRRTARRARTSRGSRPSSRCSTP